MMNKFLPFHKHITWANHLPKTLGAHIEYCETDIRNCEQIISSLNGNFSSLDVIIFIHFIVNPWFLSPQEEIRVLREMEMLSFQAALTPDPELLSLRTENELLKSIFNGTEYFSIYP